MNRKELYHCPELNTIEPFWLNRRQNPGDWSDFVKAQGQRVTAVHQVRIVLTQSLLS